MQYEKPELIVVDSALALVLGSPDGFIDNLVTGQDPEADLALGLDD